MIFLNGDYECLKRLLKPAKMVNSFDIMTLNQKMRKKLLRKIEENLKKIEIGECGEFPTEIYRHSIKELKSAKFKLIISLKNEEKSKLERFVTREEAKIMELNYFERLDKKLEPPIQIYLEDFFIVKKWDCIEYKSQILPYLSKKELEKMPINRSVCYITKRRRIFGKEKIIILEVLFYSHIDNFIKFDYDVEKVNLDELNSILFHRLTIRKNNLFRILTIVSPTGFEDKVIENIAGGEFHKNFLSKKLSVCLVDAGTGEIFSNPLDKIAEHNKRLFDIEFDEEKVEKVKRILENRLKFGEEKYIVLEDIAEEIKFDKDIIKKAFYELGKSGSCIRYIKDVGLVLEV